jgi:hypothetical protein
MKPSMDCTEMARVVVQWWAFVITVTSFRVPLNR